MGPTRDLRSGLRDRRLRGTGWIHAAILGLAAVALLGWYLRPAAPQGLDEAGPDAAELPVEAPGEDGPAAPGPEGGIADDRGRSAAAPHAGPPTISLKFVGIVGEPANPIAILEDGDEVLMAQVGDVVKDQFKVQKIQQDMLQMGFIDPRFAGENRILPIGG